jgi:hypothetical protein
MFLPGKPVYEDGPSINFSSAREAMRSPLAKRLFAIDGVTSVFFSAEYVTVTKTDTHEWGVLKPEIFAAVMDFYASGDAVVNEGEEDLVAAGTAINDDDDEIVGHDQGITRDAHQARGRRGRRRHNLPRLGRNDGDRHGEDAGRVRRMPELERDAEERDSKTC